MEKEEWDQKAAKEFNNSVGPDGLVPTLLVFQALPRLYQLTISLNQRSSVQWHSATRPKTCQNILQKGKLEMFCTQGTDPMLLAFTNVSLEHRS